MDGLLRKLAKAKLDPSGRRYVMKPKDMILKYEDKKIRVNLYFSSVTTFVENGQLKLANARVTLLAKNK